MTMLLSKHQYILKTTNKAHNKVIVYELIKTMNFDKSLTIPAITFAATCTK